MTWTAEQRVTDLDRRRDAPRRRGRPRLIMPLEGGKPRQNVVEAPITAKTGKDTSQPPDGNNPAPETD